MPKLQTTPQRRYRYEIIARAEGEQCICCYIEKRRRVGPPGYRLVIEHADNNEKNWAWHNLHLVCYSHNKKLEKFLNVRDKILQLHSYSDQLERERQRENLPTWKDVLKDMIPYEEGSAEMRANKNFFRRWNRYVRQELERYGTVNRKELIVAAAGKVGCSKQTSTNYMEVQEAVTGPFQQEDDEDGNKVIKLRDIPKLKIIQPLKHILKERKNESKSKH